MRKRIKLSIAKMMIAMTAKLALDKIFSYTTIAIVKSNLK